MTQIRASARRSLRSVIVTPANCERPWGTIEKVLLVDISADGCRIATFGAPLCLGARVLIRSAALLGGSGTVRWAEADSAGIEFDTPLLAGTLQHLEQQHGGGTTLIIPNSQTMIFEAAVP